MNAPDQMSRESVLAQLLSIIAARGSAQRIVALLRHSTREEIVGLTVEDAVMAPLTAVGRELASELGRRLPTDRPLRLFHSEVPRCFDTAERIGAGFEEAGGEVVGFATKPALAAIFIRNPEIVAREFGRRGPRAFVDAWRGGVFDPAVLAPLQEAGREQLDSMLEELADGVDLTEPAVDLHISHDVNVFALLHLVTDVTDRTLPWPGYLEGVVVEAGGEAPWTTWYHDRMGRISAS